MLQLYPLATLAAELGVSRDTLDREIAAGRLIATRVRSRVFIRSENLEAYLYRCEKPEEQPSTICRVPRLVSKEERLTEARRLRTIARGRGGR